VSNRRFDPDRADRLDSAERREWQPAAEILDRLDPSPGSVVADIGAGTGYLTFPLADRVGPTGGRVVAFDLQPGMLSRLAARAAAEGAPGPVHAVRARAEVLPAVAGAFDLVLLVDLWHELDDATAAASEARRVLRPGGRLAVLDWRPDVEDSPGPRLDHRVAAGEVARTLEEVGWMVEANGPLGPYHYLVLAW
jgi:ubiquinone/menaquinone biosynthesis C-methylase UbiE